MIAIKYNGKALDRAEYLHTQLCAEIPTTVQKWINDYDVHFELNFTVAHVVEIKVQETPTRRPLLHVREVIAGGKEETMEQAVERTMDALRRAVSELLVTSLNDSFQRQKQLVAKREGR